MTQDTRQQQEHRDFAAAFTSLPAGHDAWVVGDEEVVVVDWWGATNYARS
jgi:hypothetical protein